MVINKSRSRRNSINEGETNRYGLKYNPFEDFEGSKAELFIARVFYFLRQNIRQCLIFSVFFIFCIFSLIGYKVWKEKKAFKSLAKFRSIMKEPVMDLSSGVPDIAIEKLEAYLLRNTDDTARLRAMLYQMNYETQQGNYKAIAKKSFSIAKLVTTPALQANFYLRSALHSENLKDYKMAEEAYKQSAAALFEENEYKAMALFGQVKMLLLLNKKNAAKLILKKILSFDKVEGSKYFSLAKAYLLEIE